MSEKDPTEPETLHVIDTRHALTQEELETMKQLAAWTKTARLLLSLVLAAVAIFGVEHVYRFVENYGRHG